MHRVVQLCSVSLLKVGAPTAADEQSVACEYEASLGLVIADATVGMPGRGEHHERARAARPADLLHVIEQDIRLRAGSARNA